MLLWLVFDSRSKDDSNGSWLSEEKQVWYYSNRDNKYNTNKICTSFIIAIMHTFLKSTTSQKKGKGGDSKIQQQKLLKLIKDNKKIGSKYG